MPISLPILIQGDIFKTDSPFESKSYRQVRAGAWFWITVPLSPALAGTPFSALIELLSKIPVPPGYHQPIQAGNYFINFNSLLALKGPHYTALITQLKWASHIHILL